MFSSENIVFFILVILVISLFIWSFKQPTQQIQPQSLTSSGPFFRADIITPVLNDADIPETKVLEEITRKLINCNNATNLISAEITNLTKEILTTANERQLSFDACNKNINTLWINYNKVLSFNNKPIIPTLQAFKRKFNYYL